MHRGVRAVLAGLWLGLIAPGAGASSVPFAESYAAALLSNDHYSLIVQYIDVRADGKLPTWKEFVAAREFLRELGSEARPRFEEYSALNVDENPIAVLWSQFALRREGKSQEVSVPGNFRNLLFLQSLYEPLLGEDNRRLCNSLFLETAGRLDARSLLADTYPSSLEFNAHNLFLSRLCQNLDDAASRNKEQGVRFLAAWLLGDLPISEWFWNRELAGRVAGKFKIEGEFLQEPRQPPSCILRLAVENYADTPLVTNVVRELERRYIARVPGMMQVALFRESSGLSNVAAAVSADLGESLVAISGGLSPAFEARTVDHLPAPVVQAARTQFEAAGFDPDSTNTVADVELLRSKIVDGDLFMNCFALRALAAAAPEWPAESVEKWQARIGREASLFQYHWVTLRMLSGRSGIDLDAALAYLAGIGMIPHPAPVAEDAEPGDPSGPVSSEPAAE